MLKKKLLLDHNFYQNFLHCKRLIDINIIERYAQSTAWAPEQKWFLRGYTKGLTC
jgi:hypothetical protein